MRTPAPNLSPATLTGPHVETARMLVRRFNQEIESGLVHSCGERTETSPLGFIWVSGPSPFRAWFLESLYVALTHREPIIAFRALLQAYGYADQKGVRPANPDSYERDALLEARNRLEDVIKTVANFGAFEPA